MSLGTCSCSLKVNMYSSTLVFHHPLKHHAEVPRQSSSYGPRLRTGREEGKRVERESGPKILQKVQQLGGAPIHPGRLRNNAGTSHANIKVRFQEKFPEPRPPDLGLRGCVLFRNPLTHSCPWGRLSRANRHCLPRSSKAGAARVRRRKVVAFAPAKSR